MALSAVRNWFGWHAQPIEDEHATGSVPAPTAIEAVPLPPTRSRPPPSWNPERLAATDALWGDGYQFPGGEIETLRLAKPLGLSAATTLLLIGAGGGGACCSLATQLGAWVSGFEEDPNLVAAANERVTHKSLARRAQIETWNPGEPGFKEHFYHHCLALEPLRGHSPERILGAIATALKPSGHLMMIELVAAGPIDGNNEGVVAWARMERRDPARLPTEVQITRILGRLGFDVRVTEDISGRHTHQALMGWRTTVRGMENVRPNLTVAKRYVEEAEFWLLRLRLFQTGVLRLVRWHAIGRR